MLFLPDYFAHDKVIFGKLNFSSLFDPTGGKKKVKRLKVGPTYHLQHGLKSCHSVTFNISPNVICIFQSYQQFKLPNI